MDDLAPGDISAVTVAETPRERTFHNITVWYPGRSELDEPPPSLSPETFEEAVAALQVARGRGIEQVSEIIRRHLSDPSRRAQLEAEDRAKILRAAEFWSSSDDPDIREAGVLLGLDLAPEEYVRPALDLIREAPGHIRSGVSHRLRIHTERLSGEHILSIRDLLRENNDLWPAVKRLVFCLDANPLPQAADALAELARDGRTWLWWRALSRRKTRKALGPLESLPLELRARILIATGFNAAAADVEAVAEAKSILPGLLTTDLLNSDRDVFHEILVVLARHGERAGVEAAFRQFLRENRNYTHTVLSIALIARYLNLWNGTNLAGVGADPERELSESERRRLYKRNWRERSEEILTWFETGRRDTGSARAICALSVSRRGRAKTRSSACGAALRGRLWGAGVSRKPAISTFPTASASARV
ncbi:MAG: hypothetical protein ACYTAN_18515 [Planctomycetota bacterium]